jgi:methionine synthase II (cobalamin-independent)
VAYRPRNHATCRWINGAVAGRSADMVATLHLCRGNLRSMHIASGD